MGKGRLEAFSDGVIAIIITIMVLELHSPHGFDLAALRSLIPVFLAYVLSFMYVGIYWNNHHHLFHTAKSVNGAVLWANLHLLFWLSLLPAVTRWVDESEMAAWPLASYGFVLAMCAIAYFILTQILIRLHGQESTLARAVRCDVKGKVSVGIYIAGIVLAFVWPLGSVLCYIGAAAWWLVPDRRIEKILSEHGAL
ncbi:TMEM175 family protein [Amantichitinum ursilacus]|uniref:DUF1211 domain-containing protein n=1 Tax=Amantichitinum ursilacus TaxID=857265 RepID=A0A0N1JTJ3_9NEIS|nr:TMEM175 family protein [Amantichitinum ursilacus]KPC55374.1 hypothetical protein WG78_01915 [Amantichitinum ursilacus]